MSFDRAEYICTLLLTQRVVEREQFPELEDDAELLQEVRQRLTQVGLTLIERTGIPFLAVVVRNETVTEEVANELGLDQRALALILRIWLLLVAPHLYTGAPPPANLRTSTVTEDALALELQQNWQKTTLRSYLSRLVRAKFLEHVRGRPHTFAAGPMLWLAIDHDRLIERLKRAAVPFTAARFHEELAHYDEDAPREEDC